MEAKSRFLQTSERLYYFFSIFGPVTYSESSEFSSTLLSSEKSSFFVIFDFTFGFFL